MSTESKTIKFVSYKDNAPTDLQVNLTTTLADIIEEHVCGELTEVSLMWVKRDGTRIRITTEEQLAAEGPSVLDDGDAVVESPKKVGGA